MYGAEDEEDFFAALPSALREALEFGSAPVERDRESLDKSSTGSDRSDSPPRVKNKTRRERRSAERRGAPPRAAVELNRRYAACTNAEEVLRIYAEKGVRNDVNVATAFTRLARAPAAILGEEASATLVEESARTLGSRAYWKRLVCPSRSTARRHLPIVHTV